MTSLAPITIWVFATTCRIWSSWKRVSLPRKAYRSKRKEAEFVELSYESEQAKIRWAEITADKDAADAALKAAQAEITLIHAAVQKIDPQTTRIGMVELGNMG